MASKKQMAFFERNLTLWVLLCIGIGIIIGKVAGDSIEIISSWNLYQ